MGRWWACRDAVQFLRRGGGGGNWPKDAAWFKGHVRSIPALSFLNSLHARGYISADFIE